MLPPFNSEGVLPPGDYPLTLQQLRESLLVVGPGGNHPGWDRTWRARLVDHLAVLVGELWQVGITEIFADGSFTQDKGHPNDIDIYFHCDVKELVTGMLAFRLNAIATSPVWNWDLKNCKPDSTGKPQLPMWHRFRIDARPHFGQMAGLDIHGNHLDFPSFFRQTRDGKPRGIVKIERGS